MTRLTLPTGAPVVTLRHRISCIASEPRGFRLAATEAHSHIYRHWEMETVVTRQFLRYTPRSPTIPRGTCFLPMRVPTRIAALGLASLHRTLQTVCEPLGFLWGAEDHNSGCKSGYRRLFVMATAGIRRFRRTPKSRTIPTVTSFLPMPTKFRSVTARRPFVFWTGRLSTEQLLPTRMSRTAARRKRMLVPMAVARAGVRKRRTVALRSTSGTVSVVNH
mmetsp:Transcript_15635/g.43308  ORF Transcript_15635/g.43308 Transcript_15635/m.43308 type:complete len:219 (-) Transcript_15635:360-1016(-)